MPFTAFSTRKGLGAETATVVVGDAADAAERNNREDVPTLTAHPLCLSSRTMICLELFQESKKIPKMVIFNCPRPRKPKKWSFSHVRGLRNLQNGHFHPVGGLGNPQNGHFHTSEASETSKTVFFTPSEASEVPKMIMFAPSKGLVSFITVIVGLQKALKQWQNNIFQRLEIPNGGNLCLLEGSENVKHDVFGHKLRLLHQNFAEFVLIQAALCHR